MYSKIITKLMLNRKSTDERINERNEGKNKNALDLIFEHTGYYFPEMFSKKDNSPNGHFNNQGAAKFAAYMDLIIHEKLKL